MDRTTPFLTLPGDDDEFSGFFVYDNGQPIGLTVEVSGVGSFVLPLVSKPFVLEQLQFDL